MPQPQPMLCMHVGVGVGEHQPLRPELPPIPRIIIHIIAPIISAQGSANSRKPAPEPVTARIATSAITATHTNIILIECCMADLLRDRSRDVADSTISG